MGCQEFKVILNFIREYAAKTLPKGVRNIIIDNKTQ